MLRDVAVVHPEDKLVTAVKLMMARGVTCAVVVDEEGMVRGIITDGDIMSALRPRRPIMVDIFQFVWTFREEGGWEEKVRLLEEKCVKDFMTYPVITATETTDLAELARLMVERHIHQIPVVREGRLVGLVRRSDVVRAVARGLPSPDAGEGAG
ncbi:CBS domain-containing protein [Desulfothermobacter acidiphilus]|uniref:CBS domain-containing protein n=1 Tax=Desulfothermobacter acidiphilus TaxID=1938353 RepID=UPI003F8B5A46